MIPRRLAQGIAANIYGQGVTLGLQLAAVPVFLHAWGPARYGCWLLLAAVPSALTVADCGITTTSGYAMIAAVARGDIDEAARLFAQAFRFVSLMVLALSILAITGACAAPVQWLGAVANVPVEELRMAAAALAGCGLASLLAAVLDTALRANGDYALGFATTNTIRLVEGFAGIAIALNGGSLASAAVAAFAARLLGTTVFAALVKRRTRWVRFHKLHLRWRDMAPLCVPAVAALAVPAGLAISLQGMTWVAGAILPIAAIPAFTATRTLTRVMVQGVGLFTHALMPEMAMAVGRRDRATVESIRRQNAVLGAVTLGPACLALLAVGPALLDRWTAGAVRAEAPFFPLMVTAALFHGVWMSGANLLLAINRQADYAYTFVIVAVASCVIAWALGPHWGLTGLASAGLLGECAMAAIVLPTLSHRFADMATHSLAARAE